ncbi:alpha/beta hydrolase [Mesosutterella sp. OilRF-GAM-744-9]|uniref:Alpha/beta hydrolase n=1 Tax=Mesosutterella porci TaxID=2915351 RepID=A0ABS9MMQ6_9BURK|nr:alpha/beta hydrolase [Mesosutterella sp. oilRF-744-WT-GAM-9]MCG5029906.1 alpha/beta hydrolase [Mesosutterella sp. oilRF-744-WT-GAM-9]MCI6530830.1 alpha/beta hydrolase [Mesosutterella sp.]
MLFRFSSSFRGPRLLRAAVLALAAGAVVLSAGCSTIGTIKHNRGMDETWNEGVDGRLLADLPFKPGAGGRMDVCLPEKLDPGRGNGVIFFLHGGSWMRGTRAFERHNCYRYAKRGYIAVDLDYTLHTPSAPVTMGRMLDDIDEAVREVRRLSDERGWNVTQMAVAGTSAGGQLALLYAYGRPHSLPVKFAAANVAPIDFHWSAWDFPGAHFSPRVSLMIVNAGTGSSFSEKEFRSGAAESAIRSLSPLYAVTPSAPPTLLAYGEKDSIQNPENGRILASRLRKAGVRADLIMLPHSGHLLSDDRELTVLYHDRLAQFAREYFGY